MMRPRLEYAAVVWSPYSQKDIKKLEGTQRTATKMALEIKDLPYEENNENYSIRHRNSLGHMAPREVTGEHYISHQATKFGKDSNPGCLTGGLDISHLTNYATQPPPPTYEDRLKD
ncbi:hypothetical protein E2C01_019105 [Portunus trituberculatus]|uniref:Uncharacterized protein n=1 Tax=Portunus trituberculatus TaxID=210409 RepID=A0A5B7DXZ5_PORTR|nr:hypothetical protein [Portunus trituberculatus]